MKFTARVGILMFACVLSASGRCADRRDITAEKDYKCSMGGMDAMSLCAMREADETERWLNTVYSTLLHALENPEPLSKAQGAWLSYRELQCGFTDGPPHPFRMNLCVIHLTERRIEELEAVGPCNGCVLFKDEYYGEKKFAFPPRPPAP